MNMLDWAENEVKIASEVECRVGNDESDYGVSCYKSALKAFKSLCKDGHSGMSICITKNILNRLIDGKPLTPIEDTPDIWNEAYRSSNGDCISYQCKRMTSLFKHVYSDGRVEYADNDRVLLHNIDSNTDWHSGKARKIADEKYPITMPYIPLNEPILVYGDDYDSVNHKVGCYDHYAYYYMIHPNGKRTEINRYFKETDNGDVEITKEEYEASRLQ